MVDKCETVHDEDCQECIHHWLIDARNLGVCKKCGESKQFCSWWEAASRQRAGGIKFRKAQRNAAGTRS